jgi:hypothetical protein
MKGLALAAVALGLAAQAHAAALPTYEVGQTFIFDNGRVEQVQETKGQRITWSARSGRPYVRDVNPVVPILEWSFRGQSGVRTVVGAPERLWPLAPGRRVQFRTVNQTRDKDKRSRRSVHLWTCNVRAAAPLAVPAGAFEAFPIQCDRFSPNSMRVLERLTWHYAPEVGHYIRREARDMASGTSETYSLYTALPPRDSNPVRVEAMVQKARGDGAALSPERQKRAR